MLIVFAGLVVVTVLAGVKLVERDKVLKRLRAETHFPLGHVGYGIKDYILWAVFLISLAGALWIDLSYVGHAPVCECPGARR